MDPRSGLRTAQIFAFCAAFAAVALATTGLPALAQSALSPELEPLVQTYLSGQATVALKASVDAYVAAHPNDGNGFALQCAIDESNALSHGLDVLAVVPECQKALTLAPQSAFANYVTGDALYDGGSIADSIPYYSKAIDLGVSYGVFWKRCDAYRRTGDLTRALADCKKQLELTPNDFHALYAYGHLQYARAQYADAVTDLSLALAINPNDINALYWRGMAYASLGKFAQAETDFTRCIALGDQAADTYFERGLARRSLGENSAGTADLQEALKRYRAHGMTEQANRVEAILSGAPSNAPSPMSSPPAPPSMPRLG